ncbi:hypothetical protein [Anaerotignum sp.]|uniref:hypothetical protein n=1 Tax=Anaerotignum sp. TaxID=2039241 RepID=UPI0027151AC2|nr:hypothetical protein [Anaerotignum sp.]
MVGKDFHATIDTCGTNWRFYKIQVGYKRLPKEFIFDDFLTERYTNNEVDV